ncbi:type II and III secretion system protein family protein [Sphingomonas turrisvirgatae]|uniref:Secretion system protein n=1 Tax=Sphingomonas turrisvirgatae TaxID=1888892 RepID=A0A1E3LSX6_9SPHN|nr:type II and III secretion system protein family protein [Sphingomonas turrisvirgatae]ODP36872.1 secretion system protein [Sphingomonas turrisvirgatae]
MRSRGKTLGAPLAMAAMVSMIATVPLPALAQTVQAAPRDTVQIATGRGRLVTLNAPMSDIFVADPSIADVQVRSPTQLWVFGKKAGETTVYATTKAGRVIYSATVRIGNNFDSVQSMLGIAMPEAQITATPMNGLVLLTGTVAAPEDAAEAQRLVQAFVGQETQVLSRLKTATPLQVNLQVRFAEVSRSFVKNIGVNLATRDTTGGFQFGLSSGTRVPGTISAPDLSNLPRLDASSRFGLPAGSITLPFDPKKGDFVLPGTGSQYTFNRPTSGNALNFAGKLFGLDVLSALDLGERIGQVTTLTNPNLTALSGETSTFLAGGEVPIPVSQGLGAISVEYKQFGVSLAYPPTVLSDGRISLRVRPEVSQLNYQNGVQRGGTIVPGLSTRRAETTVELGSGQSFVIAGLLQNTHDNSIDKTPGLGDVPVLGALFRSNAFQRGETELVIVVTPYLVKPVNANDIVLPTDGYKAPTDVERVLLGELGGGKTGLDRPKPRMVAPAGSAPSVGAASPLSPEPQQAPQPQQPVATPALPPQPAAKDSKRKKGSASATPGFGFN